MPVTIKKYKFHTIKTEFCGFIIELKKFSINLKKIKAIVNQQKLSNITELQLFLRFYNYCKKFIKQWLKKIKLFIKFIRKDKS